MFGSRVTTLVFGDIVSLVLAFTAMVMIRFRGSEYEQFIGPQTRLFALLFLGWLVIFFIFDLYNLRKVNPNPRNIGTLALAVATSALISVLLFYLFPTNGITPKTNLAIVAGCSFIFLTLWRRMFYLFFASTYRQRIAVIGRGSEIAHLLKELKEHPQFGSVVYTADAYTSHDILPAVNLIIVSGGNLETLLTLTETTGAEVLSLSGAYEALFGKIPLTLMNDMRAASLLTDHHSAYRSIGRVFELLIALSVLVLSSPFVLIAMLCILIEDGGPVIYKQARTGKGGKAFFMYKLRSMKKDAEANGAQWATKHDPRSTKVGKVLRMLHLDEVPQMINIIKGDIALVGPRPERPEIVAGLERQIPYYFLRHTVKPGFTGWAQIKFRYARTVLDSQEKLEYDLYWLANRNPLFDLGILAKTVQIIFTH